MTDTFQSARAADAAEPRPDMGPDWQSDADHLNPLELMDAYSATELHDRIDTLEKALMVASTEFQPAIVSALRTAAIALGLRYATDVFRTRRAISDLEERQKDIGFALAENCPPDTAF